MTGARYMPSVRRRLDRPRQTPAAQPGGDRSVPRTVTALAIVALVVGACGGGSAAPTTAPTVAAGEPAATEAASTAAATEAPADTGSAGGGAASSRSADALKALAQQLTPAGSTETGHLEANGSYQVYVTTTQSLDQLKAFYDQKAVSIPIKDYTRVDASGSLYIGGSDPVISITAAPDPQNTDQFSLIISVGG